MERRRTVETIWVAASVLSAWLCVIFVDRAAATWSHAALHDDWFFVALTHLVDPIPPLAAIGVLAAGAGALAGRRPGPRASRVLCACAAVLVAIAIKDQLKFAFGRLWPETWVNANPSWIHDGQFGFFPFHGGTGWSSFPSGHMTVITAACAAFWREKDRWRWLLGIPIALVAVGLFGADYHFVADIIAGTLLGAVCARLILGWMEIASGRLSQVQQSR